MKLNSITLPDVNVGNVSDVNSRLIEKREEKIYKRSSILLGKIPLLVRTHARKNVFEINFEGNSQETTASISIGLMAQ